MISTTARRLRCPICANALKSSALRTVKSTLTSGAEEIVAGSLECLGCRAVYPILAGVAILVPDVAAYLQEHVKGIARLVPDDEIPAHLLDCYLEARESIEIDPIESDLESERVTSLYLANHYLEARAPEGEVPWWKPRIGSSSALIDQLIREHWDQGPLAKIADWISQATSQGAVIELGCGVGGMARRVSGISSSYLGVDSSFASVALGRHLLLGAPYSGGVRLPGELLEGPVSRALDIPVAAGFDGTVDMIVGDIESFPVAGGEFDVSLAINVIDMLEHPELLPELQHSLVKPGGSVIQSCPYIWREDVSAMLRENLPTGISDSASAARWLYERSGLEPVEELDHVPWLFFKHLRQLEIYSVHLLRTRRSS